MNEKRLVTRHELEEFLRLGKNSRVLTGIMQEKDFPKAVSLGDKSHRWFLNEVLEYLESKRKDSRHV